jgi:hypothetical protein
MIFNSGIRFCNTQSNSSLKDNDLIFKIDKNFKKILKKLLNILLILRFIKKIIWK